MSTVTFLCPFCEQEGERKVVRAVAGEAEIAHELPVCARFRDVLDDKVEADEFLKACRLRMSA